MVFSMGDGRSPIAITWTDPPARDIADLFAGHLYVRIHSGVFPQADIRDQLLEQPASEKGPIVLYPHLALGGGFQVVLLASNTKTSTFDGTVRLPSFGQGSGVPWVVNDQDMTGLDRFQISIPPRSTSRFRFSNPRGLRAIYGPGRDPRRLPRTKIQSGHNLLL